MKWYAEKLWERRYIDLWSVSHFLGGMIGAILPVYFSISPIVSIGIVFVVAVLWEIIERVKNIIVEPLSNQITDVVVALIGFWIAYRISLALPPSESSVFFVAVGVLFVGAMAVSWSAYARYMR